MCVSRTVIALTGWRNDAESSSSGSICAVARCIKFPFIRGIGQNVGVSETPPADLLAEWTTRIPARSGEMLCVRPLRPDDRAREAAFINSLSEHTRFL